jgi:FkbM family methyltransferase
MPCIGLIAMPTKEVTINGRANRISGLSEDDPYFVEIVDGYESDLARLCNRFLNRTSNCWDIGANIGVTTLVISQRCNEGRVIAVEPGTQTFKLLEQNLSANGAHNVTAVKACVGDRDGEARFVENSAFGFVPSSGDHGTLVRMVSPQTIANEFALPSLDFVKIDVEGLEFAFLRAGKALFDTYRPIIEFEFNLWCLMSNGRINPLEFAEWLFSNFPYVYWAGVKGEPPQPLNERGASWLTLDCILHRGGNANALLSYEPLTTD